MRYLIVILLILISQIANSQVTDTQLRVRADQNPDSILIMSNDTNSSSAYYKTGKWRKASDIIGAVAGDTDWYKLGGTAIPTNSDSAYRSGYTLFKGLYGGLATKIEMLKDGVLQFDIADGITDQNFIRFKPLQDGTRNVDFLMSTTTTPFSGSRNDNVFYWGWNLGAGGGVVESGKGAIGLSMEDFYNPSGTNAFSEFHLIHYDTLGNSRRPMTFLLDVGSTSTWAMALSLAEIKYTLATDVTKIGFDFTMPSGNLALFKLLNPQTGLGVEMQVNDASNEFQITNTMGGGSEIYLNSFTYCETNILRRAASFGSTATTIAGNDGSGWFTNVGTGWGIDLTSGNLVVDSSQVATQYDLTTVSGGATDLIIGGSGPTYTIESSTGTDVTIAAGTGVSLSESPANTLVITNTVTDTDDQGLTLTGTGPYTIDIDNGSDIIVDDLFGITLSEPVANTLAIKADTSVLATPYDISGFGTMSNWLLAASGTGGTETVTNGETVTISETTGLDVTRSTNTVAVALSIDEFTTDGTIEEDELLLAYDPSGTNHELIDVNSLPYIATEVDGSTTNEIQDITVTGASQPFTVDLSSDATDMTLTGAGITTLTRSTNAITITSTEVDGSTTNEIQTLDATGTTTVTWDLSSDATDISLTGAGISAISRSGNAVTVTSTEVDGSTTNEAWTIDADDADTEVISNQTVKFEGLGGIATNYIPLTNTLEIDASGVTGIADGNGIYDGSGTVPTATVATLTDNLTFSATAGEADLYIDGTNDNIGIGTNSPEEQLTISNEDSNLSYPIMGFHTDQTASASAVLGKTNFIYGAENLVAITAQKKTSTTSNDAVLMVDMLNVGGTAENAMDITIKDAYAVNKPRVSLFGGMQNSRVDSVGASITLDESYYAVRCTTATIIITLPNANTTNSEWIGTQYWIYNDSGGSVTINPNGTNDTVNGSNADITLADNAGYYLMLMSTTAGAVNNWMGLKTP